MALRNLVVGTVALLSLVSTAHALDRCSARVNPKSGAVEVSALGVSGTVGWSGSPAGGGVAFADEASCVVGDRVRRCHLGDTGTLAAITPPVECRVCVHDAGATPCCAVLRGCTPGARLRDESFAADDPRVCQGLGAADPACAPLGIWEQVEGLAQLGNVVVPDLLRLDADGGLALASHDDNGAVRCNRGVFTKGAGNQLVVDADVGSTGVFRFRRPDADTLELLDSRGQAVRYARRDAVPDDLVCREITVLQRFDGLPLPEFTTGLAFDGTAFWYTKRDGDSIPIDATSGAVGTPLTLPGVVEAAQGATFWTAGGLTASRAEIRRVQRNGVVTDVVTPPAGTAGAPSITAVAVDEANARLLLATESPTGDAHALLGVHADAEPDDFFSSVDIGLEVTGIVFDGHDLWAVDQQNRLFRIDPASGAIRETYLLPGDAHWQSITIAGGDLTLLGIAFHRGATTIADGVILRVRPA